ncbi:uncharacterized protein C8R40DRAFT_1172480 [Lentinula edodes]|uniref:uncharacterized protein n=1 Tax=Lentinula edodes TaxID=5353 RepID=UPI001E8D4316|nr:uncharacterized protein C8R40DRAFT_1172480 [Lentinula edodes]KAH7873684.1 hypothetical protein C8R40DRAFT_1172480 [Lentinula edodes]
MSARFRTVDVDDQVQVALLRKDSRRLRYVCNAVGDSHSAFIDAFTSYPTLLRNLEIRGTDFIATKEQINKAIVAFSGTLTRFIIHNSLRMSYQEFCGVLKSLGHCKMLRALTLPPPGRGLGDCPSTRQRADEAHAAIQAMAHGEEEKAKLAFLQLIPSSYRHEPQYTGKAPRAEEYEWLSGRRCPFDLSELETLVLGAVSTAQILLPSISEHLTRLEFCLPFDNRCAWTEYENLLGAPIILPALRYLGLTFHIHPSNWLLDVIRTPAIKTICIKWNTSISYSTYETQFRSIDNQISRLDDGHGIPQHLSNIHLLTIFCPDAHWCAQTFPLCTQLGVNVSSSTGSTGI